MASEVLAVIPARGGSKGIPRKNIIMVGGKPLIARITTRSVQQLQIAPGIALYAQIKSVALMD